MKTIQECAKEAIFVQDACNLSGVIYSFAKVMETICEEARAKNHGTDWRNTHPIVRLFADKIRDMAYRDGWHDEGEADLNDSQKYMRASRFCEELANE